jgi:hypothetical protein
MATSAKTTRKTIVKAPKKPKIKYSAPRRGAKIIEPSWEGALEWDGATFHSSRRRAADFYYEYFKSADLMPHLWTWMKDNDYTPVDIKAAKAAPNHKINISTCYIARMLLNGMPDYHKGHAEYWASLDGTMGEIKPASEHLHKVLQEVITLGMPLVAQKEQAEKELARQASNVVVYKKPTIQDRLNEKVSEIIGELEGRYDAIILGGNTPPEAYKLFQDENLPQAKIGMVVDHFSKFKTSLENDWALSKKGDEQCKEAYSHMKVSDFKRHIAWYESVLADCESFSNLKKTARKARIKKAPSKEKLVAKIKFCKEDTDLKIASINPVDILGASELWTYNIKTRKLGKYVAKDSAGLSVKGTTIEDFIEVSSVQKTLRKPAEQLVEFTKAGKIQLRKFMESIKTTDTKLNGRINTDTLLLKVQ